MFGIFHLADWNCRIFNAKVCYGISLGAGAVTTRDEQPTGPCDVCDRMSRGSDAD